MSTREEKRKGDKGRGGEGRGGEGRGGEGRSRVQFVVVFLLGSGCRAQPRGCCGIKYCTAGGC